MIIVRVLSYKTKTLTSVYNIPAVDNVLAFIAEN